MRTRLIDNYTCSNARRSPAERELRWKPGGLPPVGGRERLPCFIIVHSHQQWDGATQMLNAQSPRRELSRSPPESIAWIFPRRPSKAAKRDLCISPATQHQSCGPPAPTHGDPKYLRWCFSQRAILEPFGLNSSRVWIARHSRLGGGGPEHATPARQSLISMQLALDFREITLAMAHRDVVFSRS